MSRERSPHALGFAAVAAALLLAAAALPIDQPPLSLLACPVRAATGLPCLTCGCSHAFHHFVRGRFLTAFLSSPLGFVLALACAAHLALVLLRLDWPRLRLSQRSLRWTVGSAVVANWIFLALRSAP